ncbi:hypothetical protein CEXT_53481 [Caerostris extrusa]|uniref:Uncharacterized protein n=1 Tax=Caerostris extrusa TaxID=172846 RepID=A0AAV4TQ97_CAEEX|nr:hypothetical protein CEXT_53481 [Caerostris extrusa]
MNSENCNNFVGKRQNKKEKDLLSLEPSYTQIIVLECVSSKENECPVFTPRRKTDQSSHTQDRDGKIPYHRTTDLNSRVFPSYFIGYPHCGGGLLQQPSPEDYGTTEVFSLKACSQPSLEIDPLFTNSTWGWNGEDHDRWSL